MKTAKTVIRGWGADRQERDVARGLLSGLIWGSVIAVGGAAVVSVTNPLPQAPAVSSNEPGVSEPAAASEPASVPSAQSGAESAADQPESPAAPQSDTLAALENADTTPAEAPVVQDASPLGDAAEPDDQTPAISTTSEAPPAPNVATPAPTAPAGSDGVSISTEPAQPTPPAPADQGSGFAPSEPKVTVAAPSEPQTPAEPAPTANPVTDTGEAAEETVAEPRVAALPRVEPETPEGPRDDPEAEASAQPVAPSPGIGQRVAPLTERTPGASSLPSVAPAPEPAAELEAAPEPAANPDAPPFERFVAPFSNPDDKPLLSIVLIDDEGSIGAEALQTFPYPLTFALNPFDPDAPEKMARYRAAGFEVLAMVDLPLDATAQDAETALEVGLGTLNEVIGVIEGVDSGVQGSRPLSDQVTAILRDKGYGFITQNSGLNTVQKLAAREGVPSAFVFRDFDGANQTPTVMRRFLDQAAFRAGQEGGVIMLGRVRPDTVSALLLWGLQDRASRVALAPASAILAQPTAPDN